MEPKVSWRPPPDESSSAELPDFLRPLIEALAEKIHNRWSAKRLEEGWTYGPERNDKLRTTPNLVAYESLPEIEKEYDRATAIATLKNLYADGYRITRAEAGADDAGETAAVAARLRDQEHLRFADADLLWRGHSQDFWRAHPELLLALAKRCSDAGWPLLAFDTASRALAGEGQLPAPLEDRLRHIAVLSLMEAGALERAETELTKIRTDEWIEGDLHGLRGRLAKARGLRAKDAGEANRHFRAARDIYLSAYRQAQAKFAASGDKSDGAEAYYLGINAATMSAWAGMTDEARDLAAEVLGTCEVLAGATADPWLEATRGEAHLLRGDLSAAADAYRRAATALRGQWRPLQSMRRQALETAKRAGFPRAEVEGWFPIPALCVRGFPGNADGPAPAGAIVFYYLHEAGQLDDAETTCAASAEFHLCLAAPHDALDGRLTAEERAKLERIIAGATRVLGKEEQAVAGENAVAALAPLLFRGAVLLRAQELDVVPQGLPALAACTPDGPVVLRALLCADAKGYSRLDNKLLEVFVKDFLGCVGEVVAKFRDRTLTVKTAGDGLFMAFRDLASAVAFSLTLRDATTAVDWAARGMPDDLGLRISLDAGPMLEFTDPVTGRTDVAGRLVNRAARIEPITPVNHVYASRTLAALASALEIPGVRFEYAGEIPLPKGFGAFQLYHLTAA